MKTIVYPHEEKNILDATKRLLKAEVDVSSKNSTKFEKEIASDHLFEAKRDLKRALSIPQMYLLPSGDLTHRLDLAVLYWKLESKRRKNEFTE